MDTHGINVMALEQRMSNFVGLATETFEFFLNELSDLRGEAAISPSFWTLPSSTSCNFRRVNHYNWELIDFKLPK